LIKPHRQGNLLQLICLANGEAQTWIDGNIVKLQPPCVQLIPPMCVHGFEFSSNIEGQVISVALPLVKHLGANLGEQHILLQQFASLPLSASDAKQLEGLLQSLAQEYHQR